MDAVLCDELLQEIFHRLPASSSPAVSLVSKRWLHLLRSSASSLSLRFSNPPIRTSLSSFLSDHQSLSSLSLSTTTVVFADQLLLAVAFSCPNLRHLRFLAGPVTLFSLISLSTSCPLLSVLAITLYRPLALSWLAQLRSLKHLAIFITGNSTGPQTLQFNFPGNDESDDDELNLESLCLTGSRAGDHGLNWLWMNCKKLKILKLKSCEGVGDNSSFLAFIKNLKALEEIELRTCRTIVDRVLVKLAENCVSLNSLLVYDGASKEGLLQFIAHSRCLLRKLDLRLPLDLDNDHLIAVAEKFGCLSGLRLQSCCLVTGEGLKTLVKSVSDGLEELALINCDVIERESGLLTTLGQNLKRLRKLDLSYNEMLLDKEFTSMLVSCSNLKELRLRGCNKLTDAAMISLSRSCKQLEIVDIMYCCRIDSGGIESFFLNSPHLRQVEVEENKLSVVARTWASDKFIEIVA